MVRGSILDELQADQEVKRNLCKTCTWLGSLDAAERVQLEVALLDSKRFTVSSIERWMARHQIKGPGRSSLQTHRKARHKVTP